MTDPIHRVNSSSGKHNAVHRPFGLNRSPSVQSVDISLGSSSVRGQVETETSNFELTVCQDDTTVHLVNHAGVGSVVKRGGIVIEALDYGLKVTEPGRVGYLVRWPKRWPTAAEILLPTKILHPHLEADHPPCGYIRDFGIAMRAELVAGRSDDWHAHESEVTAIKLSGKALFEIFGSTGSQEVGHTTPIGTTQIVHSAGEVIEFSPGTLHRVTGIAVEPPVPLCYKLMYHQGVNGSTLAEAFPQWGEGLRHLPAEIPQSFAAPTARVPFEGDTPGCGLMKDLTPMFLDATIGAEPSHVLKRSAQVGTVFRTAHEAKRYSKPRTVHGEYMLTVTAGSLKIKVRGLVMNTIVGGQAIKLPSTEYSLPLLKAKSVNGWTTVSLPQTETILLHEGCTYQAKAAADGTVSVTNYLMADVSKRGKETVTE